MQLLTEGATTLINWVD